MLSELFQLDEPPPDDNDDGAGSLRAGGSEDSYSDDDREEDVVDELSDASDESDSYRKQDDSKAVAVIRSVGELSIPEKYTSTHHIRVSSEMDLGIFYRISTVEKCTKHCRKSVSRKWQKKSMQP